MHTEYHQSTIPNTTPGFTGESTLLRLDFFGNFVSMRTFMTRPDRTLHETSEVIIRLDAFESAKAVLLENTKHLKTYQKTDE